MYSLISASFWISSYESSCLLLSLNILALYNASPLVSNVMHLYLGHIWLYLTFMESSLPSYIKLLRNNEKSLRLFYKKYALLRDTEVRK